MKTVYKFKNVGETGKGSVKIAGYANFFTIDAVKERMDPQSVILDRFMKNPVMLFEHDQKYPIGKFTKVEPREDGVWIEGYVSGSKSEKVSYVRDLVKEGVLKTLSIRYDVEDVNKSFKQDPLHNDGTLIKDWELQEVSIVSIPCQPDSVFSLVGVKSLGEAREMVLRAKGAKAASLINKRIDAVVAKGSSKEELMQRLSQQAGMDPGEIADVLAGEITPIPEAFINACCDILEMEKTEIKEADSNDVDGEDPKADEKLEQKEKALEAEEDEDKEKSGCDSDKSEDEEEDKEEEKSISEDSEDSEKQEKEDEEKGESGKKMLEDHQENPVVDAIMNLTAMVGQMASEIKMMNEKMVGISTEKTEDPVSDIVSESTEEEKAVQEEEKEDLTLDEEQKSDSSEGAETAAEKADEEEEEDEEKLVDDGLKSLKAKYSKEAKELGIDLDALL